MTRIQGIRWVGDNAYAVTLTVDGKEVTTTCQVEESRGVLGVQPDPDVFMWADFDTRPVVAAIVAFHRISGGMVEHGSPGGQAKAG